MKTQSLRIEILRAPCFLVAVRAFVVAVARNAGFDERATGEIEIAVDEACAAAIGPPDAETARAPGELVAVTARIDASDVVFTILDRGGRVAPDAPELEGEGEGEPDSDPESGLGMLACSVFMDELDFGQGDDGTEVVLVRHRPRRNEAPDV